MHSILTHDMQSGGKEHSIGDMAYPELELDFGELSVVSALLQKNQERP